MEKHLHIISLTIPFPVNYGGAFDLFYKLPALQQQGVHIHLHCFENGYKHQIELNKYCDTVNYYKRKKGYKNFISLLPYIVSSRKNESLFQNLLQDDYPIFMEGIHCTYLLNDPRFINRKKFVRIHNVEYQYYNQLFQSATTFLHKLFYWREKNLLKKYEKNIGTKATAFWGITQKDVAFYTNQLNCKTINYLPVYLPKKWQLNNLDEKGNYCLYQGDLSVDTNEKVAIWLIEKVFNKIQFPFIIAGKNPSKKLQKKVISKQNIYLVANPNNQEMQDLIAKAHLNILPSFSNTGIKLKLLNALFNGRFVIVNEASIEGSNLDGLCHLASDAQSFQKKITALFSQPFASEIIERRKKILYSMFNNEANAKQQVQWIWG